MDEKRSINLTIDGIPMNLIIQASEEEIVRKAAKEINERVSKYKSGYTEPESFYFLAYATLQYAIKAKPIQYILKTIKIEYTYSSLSRGNNKLSHANGSPIT